MKRKIDISNKHKFLFNISNKQKIFVNIIIKIKKAYLSLKNSYKYKNNSVKILLKKYIKLYIIINANNKCAIFSRLFIKFINSYKIKLSECVTYVKKYMHIKSTYITNSILTTKLYIKMLFNAINSHFKCNNTVFLHKFFKFGNKASINCKSNCYNKKFLHIKSNIGHNTQAKCVLVKYSKLNELPIYLNQNNKNLIDVVKTVI